MNFNVVPSQQYKNMKQLFYYLHLFEYLLSIVNKLLIAVKCINEWFYYKISTFLRDTDNQTTNFHNSREE